MTNPPHFLGGKLRHSQGSGTGWEGQSPLVWPQHPGSDRLMRQNLVLGKWPHILAPSSSLWGELVIARRSDGGFLGAAPWTQTPSPFCSDFSTAHCLFLSLAQAIVTAHVAPRIASSH